MQWCHSCCWHHVTLMPMVLASNFQKTFAPYFSCLDLINAMVLLPILMALYDTRAGVNCITWPKSLCCTSFWWYWPKEYHGSLDGAVQIIWCWHQCSGITWHQHQCQWCQCWCQGHQMTKNTLVVLNFNCLNLMNSWCHWWCFQHDVTLIQVPLASNNKKFISSFQLSWPKEYTCTCFSATGHHVMPTLAPVLHLILVILT